MTLSRGVSYANDAYDTMVETTPSRSWTVVDTSLSEVDKAFGSVPNRSGVKSCEQPRHGDTVSIQSGYRTIN